MAEQTDGFRVPRWFAERAHRHYDLSPADRLVFVMLCSGGKRGSRVVSMSTADLERITALSRTTVKASMKYLAKIGLIVRVSAAVGRRPAAYEIPQHMPWPEMVFGPGRRATHDGMGWQAAGES